MSQLELTDTIIKTLQLENESRTHDTPITVHLFMPMKIVQKEHSTGNIDQ